MLNVDTFFSRLLDPFSPRASPASEESDQGDSEILSLERERASPSSSLSLNQKANEPTLTNVSSPERQSKAGSEGRDEVVIASTPQRLSPAPSFRHSHRVAQPSNSNSSPIMTKFIPSPGKFPGKASANLHKLRVPYSTDKEIRHDHREMHMDDGTPDPEQKSRRPIRKDSPQDGAQLCSTLDSWLARLTSE